LNERWLDGSKLALNREFWGDFRGFRGGLRGGFAALLGGAGGFCAWIGAEGKICISIYRGRRRGGHIVSRCQKRAILRRKVAIFERKPAFSGQNQGVLFTD
jgi:hypothetical protein